jgi:hypothetical protein
MQRQRHWGVEAPVFQAPIKLENILDFKLNIGSSRKTLGLNALLKCSGREFSRQEWGRQVSLDTIPEAPRGIHKRYCNSSRTVLENAGKTKETLGEIFL